METFLALQFFEVVVTKLSYKGRVVFCIEIGRKDFCEFGYILNNEGVKVVAPSNSGVFLLFLVILLEAFYKYALGNLFWLVW